MTMKIKNRIVYKGDAPLTLPIGGKKDRKTTVSEQRKIDKCLNCTKSARECKGDCE